MASNNHFDLTLDTLAPSGSVTRPSAFLGANDKLTISKGDATYMYLWFDKKQIGDIADLPSERLEADVEYTTKFVTDGRYYYHLVLEDDLGNKSPVYDTGIICYDLTSPVVSSLLINDGATVTNVREVSLQIDFNDPGSESSGVASYTLSGDLADSVAKTGTFTTEQISAGSAVLNIVLSGIGPEDVAKTVSVVVTDNCGKSSELKSSSIVLDTEKLTGNILVKNGEGSIINNLWVNYNDIEVTLEVLSATVSDWVGYKLWGDINDDGSATPTEEPVEYTSVEKGSALVFDKKLTSGDNVSKFVNAKVIDDAGNETTLTPAAVKADYSAPAASIAISSTVPNYISEVDGYNEVTITPTVNCDISGLSTYMLMLDDQETSKTGSTLPSSIVFAATDVQGDGLHKFKLVVKDAAGNETTSNEVSIVKDTTAPVGTITMSGWKNANDFLTLGATASATDAHSGLATMTCWCSTSAEDTNVKGSSIAYKVNPLHSDIDWSNYGESPNNYIHIEYVDNVGNKSIAHSGAFGIDRQAPNTGSVEFSKAAYNSRNATISLTYSDVGASGVSEMCIAGPIEASGEWESVAASKTVVFTGGDGTKNISVLFKDLAGNVSEIAATASAEYDSTAPSLEVTMFEADDATVKPAISNVASFILHVKCADDGGESSHEGVEYKIYGDFSTVPNQESGTSEPETWLPVSYESGKSYMKLSGLYVTKDKSESGEGQLKTIYVKIRDNAGNESSDSVGFTYNQSAPEVTVVEPDFNRISKVQELRKTSSGEIEGKYNDQIHFSFTPSIKIQAYQVCAYLDREAAEAGTHETGVITADERCANISATGLSSRDTVYVTLSGAAYENALKTGTESVDGAHFIVVYVQDLAGTWSNAAEFIN